MIKEIRRRWLLRFPNFEMSEVLSPDGVALVLKTGQIPINQNAMAKLQAFRVWLNRPIKVNSDKLKLRGFRSSTENKGIKGAANFSFHLLGMAFDISADGMSTQELFDKAKEFGWGGIGLYDTWVHVDDRIM